MKALGEICSTPSSWFLLLAILALLACSRPDTPVSASVVRWFLPVCLHTILPLHVSVSVSLLFYKDTRPIGLAHLFHHHLGCVIKGRYTCPSALTLHCLRVAAWDANVPGLSWSVSLSAEKTFPCVFSVTKAQGKSKRGVACI